MFTYYDFVNYAYYNRWSKDSVGFDITDIHMTDTDVIVDLVDYFVGTKSISIPLELLEQLLKEHKVYISAGIQKLKETVFKESIAEENTIYKREKLRANLLYPKLDKNPKLQIELIQKGVLLNYLVRTNWIEVRREFVKNGIHLDYVLCRSNHDTEVRRLMVSCGYAVDLLQFDPDLVVRTLAQDKIRSNKSV